MRKGQIIGNYIVVCDKPKKDIKGNTMYKTKHVTLGRIKYRTIYNIQYSLNKAPVGNKGHSTRTKHKTLPKYVYLHKSNNKGRYTYYKVCKKESGKVRTLAYFKSLKEAAILAQSI